MNKRLIFSLLLFSFLIVYFVPLVSAHVPLGNTGYSTSSSFSFYTADSLIFSPYSTSGWADSQVEVTHGHAYLSEDGQDAYVNTKMVVLDNSKHIVGVSDVVSVKNQGLYQFNFSEPCVLNKSEGNYSLGFIHSTGQFDIFWDGLINRYQDDSNSYDTPQSADDASFSASAQNMGVYIDLDTYYPPATSTPSPSPVPTVRVETQFTSVPSYYMIILVLFAVVAVLAGIYMGFEKDGDNKGVAFLFALVALVIFVVLIVGYLIG